MHACIKAYIKAYMHTCIHACDVCAHVCTLPPLYTLQFFLSCLPACMRVCMCRQELHICTDKIPLWQKHASKVPLLPIFQFNPSRYATAWICFRKFFYWDPEVRWHAWYVLCVDPYISLCGDISISVCVCVCVCVCLWLVVRWHVWYILCRWSIRLPVCGKCACVCACVCGRTLTCVIRPLRLIHTSPCVVIYPSVCVCVCVSEWFYIHCIHACAFFIHARTRICKHVCVCTYTYMHLYTTRCIHIRREVKWSVHARGFTWTRQHFPHLCIKHENTSESMGRLCFFLLILISEEKRAKKQNVFQTLAIIYFFF